MKIQAKQAADNWLNSLEQSWPALTSTEQDLLRHVRWLEELTQRQGHALIDAARRLALATSKP